MTQANFKFISDAAGGDRFTVISFTGHEAISSLYEYKVEIKAPLSASINLDDVLDSPARFITDLDGMEYPVFGMLSNFEELQTVQDYVHFKAVLVPRLWGLSIYKTNEIYTQEKTVDLIIETVLENAGLVGGTDYDLNGLAKGPLLSRDYVCQFGESDFDFISRLMENEGIFYYFDHSNGEVEKIIFINDMNYELITQPGLTFDVTPSTSKQYDCIDAWSCRKQRLAGGVTVRDFNPDHPSMDIANTTLIDRMSKGTDYYYGENIQGSDEATYLSEIRAEESLCKKTRYYGESSVTRLQAGYLFEMDMHPNENYNGIEYLAVEVNHEGQHLDTQISSGTTQAQPQYRNNFVATQADEQFRPVRLTPKPRFYGTMTAFVYAEAAGSTSAEVDEQGRYRVHLPFDRADGSKDSDDPHRKASTWIRMAQPYVGENEGMYFPLKGGTEVLLTFINGDPDQPIISAALPNASTPSMLNANNAHVATVSTPGSYSMTIGSGSYSNKSVPLIPRANQSSASDTASSSDAYIAVNSEWRAYGPAENQAIFDCFYTATLDTESAIPVVTIASDGSSTSQTGPTSSRAEDYPFTKMNDFGMPNAAPGQMSDTEEDLNDGDHIDRSTGPTYVHHIGSTFAYPEQERVYFCGPFHEDFHMDDCGVIGMQRPRDPTTGIIDYVTAPSDKDSNSPGGPDEEIFFFPEPGGDGTQPVDPVDPTPAEKLRFPRDRPRGVSEDKRWGDQMNYAWGRIFNWGGGSELGAGNAGGEYNYGNAYTENLLEVSGYTVSKILSIESNADPDHGNPDSTGHITDLVTKSRFEEYKEHKDDWKNFLGDRATNLKDCKVLQADTLSAEKTFGNTYSYQMGCAVDIHEGYSISKTYGDTDEYVSGNLIEHIDGDTTSFYQGETNATYHGQLHEYTMAGKFEANLSAGAAFSFAESFELYGGAKQDIMIGSAIEVHIGSKWEFQLELVIPSLNISYAPAIELGFGPALEYCPLKLDMTDTADVKKVKAKIEEVKFGFHMATFGVFAGNASFFG